jgi:hypothetical protein
MLYTPLELGQPGNPKCPDRYNDDSTLIVPGCTRLLLQVSAQTLIVQLGIMPQGRGVSEGSVQWQAEDPYLPMIAALNRSFDAVRVRNFSPGIEAQVFIHFS